MRIDYQALEAFVARFYQGRKLLLEPYGYVASFGAIAQNAQSTQQVQIAANADFVMVGARWRSILNNGLGQTVNNLPVPFLRMLITDNGSGQQLTAQPVDLAAYAGSTVDDAFGLPYPRIVAGRSSLSVQLTNYSPAAGENYSLTDVFLEGVLVRAYQD